MPRTLTRERILQRCDALYAQARRVRFSETRAHINAMRDALLWAAGELSAGGDDDIAEFLTDDYLHDCLAPDIIHSMTSNHG